MNKPFYFIKSLVQRGLCNDDLASITRLYTNNENVNEFFIKVNMCLSIDNFIQPKLIIASLEEHDELRY